MNRLLTILIFFGFNIFTIIHAQEQFMQIKGTIIDSTLEKQIVFAKAFLIKSQDSTIITYKTTDRTGSFEFNIPIDTVRLIINHPKFDEKEFLIVGSNEQNTFDLGEIYPPEKGKGLDEVIILAFKDPIYFKGDTLVYVADSFKTRPNAVVEDLLKRLPGVKVEKDGSIKVQGKEVKKVLVDGDEFFGSDATLATRNLSANSIQTVEVYEKEEVGSTSADDKIQVLDLKLKDEFKKGYFGEVALGSDFTHYHEGKVFANYFTQKTKISIFGMGANTLESAISWSQANQYGLDHLNAYQYDSESDSWQQNENNFDGERGFPVLYRTGALYNGQLSKKITINANYTYTEFQLRIKTETRNQFRFIDTTYYNNSTTESTSKTKQHLANLSLTYKIDSTTTLTFKPRFLHQNEASNSNNLFSFSNENNIRTRTGNNIQENNKIGFNIKTPLILEKLFQKKNRKFILTNNFTYDKADKNGVLKYDDENEQPGFGNLQIDQHKSGNTSIVSNLTQATFLEPFTKHIKVAFKLEHFFTKNQDNILSYNPENGVYDILDSLTSNQFQSLKNKSTAGAQFIYEKKKNKLQIGVDGSYISTQNANLINNNTINQKQFFILPNMRYIWSISKTSQLNTSIKTNTNLPTNVFLQPIYNNTNPNFISLGSPDLKPSYSVSTNNYYYIFKSSTGYQSSVYMNAVYSYNAFVSDIQFDNQGRQFSSYYNKDKFDYSSIGANFRIPFFKRILSLDPSFGYSNNLVIGRINGLENKTFVNRLDPGLELSANTDFLYISIGSKYSYAIRQNKNSFTDNIVNATWVHTAEAEFYLPKEIELGISYVVTQYNNLAQSFNITRQILSARIEVPLGKHKNYIITAQVHDLLNQNQFVSRYNTINQISDTRTNSIGRYYLLRFTYKFNSTYKKNKENENNLDTDH